jgi:predicted kinase
MNTENTLFIPVGVSGSGKSFLGNWLQKNYKDIEIVCPDDIRAEKFGDINDQEHGGVVFMIANKSIASNLKNNKNVYFSATNLSLNNTLKDLEKLGIFEELTPVNVLIIFLEDSNDTELCKNRIKKDLENKINRSNVPTTVVDKQNERFINTKNNIDSLVTKWKPIIGNITYVEDKGPEWNKIKKILS